MQIENSSTTVRDGYCRAANNNCWYESSVQFVKQGLIDRNGMIVSGTVCERLGKTSAVAKLIDVFQWTSSDILEDTWLTWVGD